MGGDGGGGETSSGAALTFPQQASACRQGSFLMIKERACKITAMSISKTGKHGHAKCKFVGVDIFDGSKHEMLESSTHNVFVPNVTRAELQCIDIDEDGFLTLMLDSGDTREDLKFPEDEEVVAKINGFKDADEDYTVTVLQAVRNGAFYEQIIDAKRLAN